MLMSFLCLFVPRLINELEETEALRAAPKSTLQAREENLQLYHDMMSHVKRGFPAGTVTSTSRTLTMGACYSRPGRTSRPTKPLPSPVTPAAGKDKENRLSLSWHTKCHLYPWSPLPFEPKTSICFEPCWPRTEDYLFGWVTHCRVFKLANKSILDPQEWR